MEYRSRRIMDVIVNSDLVLFIGFASRAAATAKAGRIRAARILPCFGCPKLQVTRWETRGRKREEISSSFQRGGFRAIDCSCKLVKLAVLS